MCRPACTLPRARLSCKRREKDYSATITRRRSSVVKQPAQVEAVLKSALGSNVASLDAHKVKIAGVGAVEADAILKINAADGTPITAYATIYFLPTKKGVVDIDYTSVTPQSSDTTLHTMVKSIRLS